MTTPISIPILRKGKKPCYKYLRALEFAIKSDGCTGVTEAYHDCCVYHDLGYRFGINIYGNPITREEADTNFRLCIQSHSAFGRLSPMSWWRYVGVRWFGARCYTKEIPSFETYQF